jgi:hypothetical protein
MPNKQTHAFYLTQNEQTFRLQDVIDNLDGTKRIHVKNVTFNKGYFNITNATEINWTTDRSNRPARREPPATRPADKHVNDRPAEREPPATEIDLSNKMLRQLPLVMPIGEILQSTGFVLNRVLTDMITAYEAGELDAFNSKIDLELRVINKQLNNLENVVRDKNQYSNVKDTATYLILLLRERSGFIYEGMRLGQELIDSGYDRDNEAHTRAVRSLSRVRGAVMVSEL